MEVNREMVWDSVLNDSVRDVKYCKICGAKSSGNHYGCQSCEGCKAFFRRARRHGLIYRCFLGGTCTIKEKQRDCCKGCRYRKCVEEGMVYENFIPRKKPRVSHIIIAAEPSTETLPQETSQLPLLNGKFGGISPDSVNSLSPDYLKKPLISLHQQRAATNNPLPTEFFPPNSSLNEGGSTVGTSAATFENESRSLCSLVDHSLDQHLSSIDELTMAVNGSISVRVLGNLRTFLQSQAPIQNRAERRLVASSMKPTRSFDLAACTDPNSFLVKYWSLIRQDHGSLNDTVKGVDDMWRKVYSDQIQLWTSFMDAVSTFGQIPSQPQTSLDNMVRLFQSNTLDEVERHTQVASMLSGFNSLALAHKRKIHLERGCHVWLIRHAKFMRNNDLFFLTVEEDVHYCRFWTNQLLDDDLMAYLFRVALDINSLCLDSTETYLLLALALFWPDPSDNKRPRDCDFFYTYYLDILILLVGNRCQDILERLQTVVGHFKCIQRLQTEYILTLDCSRAPFVPKTGLGFKPVKEILAETDNILCDTEWPFL